VTHQWPNWRNAARILSAILLALALVPISTRAQTPTQDALARFPVAHEHGKDWCLGYLYIYPDSIAYEVTWPATMKSHSFDLKLTNIQQVSQWSVSGQMANAVEVKTNSSVYHFWWLANEQDVVNGRSYQFNPPDAGDPALLISAIRNPASLNAPPAAAAPAANPAPAQQNNPPQQMPSSPLAGAMQTSQAPQSSQASQSPLSQYMQPGAVSATPAPAPIANAAASQETRFAVVHAHAAGQCAGYLFVSATHVRYQVAQSQNDKKHSFDISRAEITGVQQWILMGKPLNAVEIKTAHGAFHFWLLPDNADVTNTPATKWGVNNVVAANPLFAALQVQAPR
jgi:hypothetical protein